MKILIIQQKMIGDVLTSSMLFEILRQSFPKAQLDYLINEHTYPVVENNPFINNFIFFSKKEESSIKALFQLALSIKNKKYDIVIDVYSKLSSNIISVLSKAKTKISYQKTYSSFIYSHNIKLLSKGSNLAIENRLRLLNPLGINAKSVQPKIYLKQEEILKGKQFLQENGLDLNKPLYMISVIGSSLNKTYPFAYMAKVIDIIVNQTNAQILFNYIPKQEKEASEIFSLCNSNTKNHIFFNVFARNLRDFLALTYHCNAVIGNEGGAINMAKALNIRTFAIFSPWIKKAAWNLFEDNNNICVHLKDYKPEIFMKPEKKYKKEALNLYLHFSTDFFIHKLIDFLK